jgi:thiol-disulfide isomerase/thioredoxin
MQKSSSWKLFVLLGVGLIFGTFVGSVIYFAGNLSSNSTVRKDSPEIGKAAPEIKLQDLDGNEVSTSSFVGHPLVLNFWASWCAPCKAEMPLLEAYAEKYPDLMLLGINNNESPATIRHFIESNPIDFPILLDEDGKVGDQFLVVGFPTTYFIDQDGTIQAVYMGQLDENLLALYLPKIGITP